MNPRTVLKGGVAVALTAHTAVASEELPVDRLGNLIAEHRRMLDVDSAAWERAGDLEASIKNHKLPKVQSHSVFQGRDAEGNAILTVQFCYSEEEIHEKSASDLRHRLLITPESMHEKVRAEHAAQYDEKIADFRAQQAEYDRREKESGYADAVKIARAASSTVMQLEAEIVAFVPSTLQEAVCKAAWCAWAYREERCYLKDTEVTEGLLAALDAIGRAA